MAKAKKSKLTIEDALVPVGEQPYEILENWCWVRMGVIANNQYGYTAKAIYDDSLPKMLRITDIQDNSVDWNDVPNCEITDEDLDKYLLHIGDIVIARTGATTGKSYYIDEEKKSVFASFLIRLSVNERINKEYIYQFLQTDMYWKQISELSSGIAQPGVNSSKLLTMMVPLPPLAEQKRIVEQIENLFFKLDEAKEKAQEALDSFEIRRSAVMQKVIDEAVDKSKDCQLKSLSDISEIVSGFAFSSADFSEENSVPCIKITNVGVKEYNDSEYQYLPQDFIDKYERFVVKEGDILISLTRSFINAGLKVCRYNKNENALLNQRVALIRNCDKEYVYYYLQTDKVLQYVKQKSKTTNQPNLSIKDLNALKIPVLTPSEQKTVVRQLDATLGMEDEIKERIASVISRIDLMKKSILAKAFRGELGTNIADEESSIELLKSILESF